MNYFCETCKQIIPIEVANTQKACPGCRKPLLLSFGDDSVLLARGFTHYTSGCNSSAAPPPTRTEESEILPAPEPVVRQSPTPTPAPQPSAESLKHGAAGRNQVTGGPIGCNDKQERNATLFQVIVFLVAVFVCGTILYILWVKRHEIIRAVTGIILLLLVIALIILFTIPRRRRWR